MHKETIPRSIFSVNFKKRFSFFLLIVLTIHTEKATGTISVVDDVDHDSIDLTVTSTGGESIKITNAATMNPGSVTANPQTPGAGTAGTSHSVVWSGLSPNTEFTYTLSKVQLTDDTNLAGTTDGDYTEKICTKPEDASSGSVVDGETTSTQVKITWTNPDSLGSIKVKRGATEDTITDTDVNEYIFTGLSAEDSGTCEVTILGSGPCSSEESATALSIASCNTKHADLVAAETITAKKISVDFSLSNNAQFTIADPSLKKGGVAETGTNDGSTPKASHTFVWDNLDANTKYELDLGEIKDTDNSDKVVADSKKLTYCTLPEAATLSANQGIIKATTSEITIKWTNPASVGGIKVSWGSTFETTLTDTSLTEYTFKESSDGKPLAAGSKGSCKVIILGSVDCPGSESTVLEIQECNTKSFTPRIELSLSVFLVCILNYFVSIDN